MLITYHMLQEAAALVNVCQAALAAALPRFPVKLNGLVCGSSGICCNFSLPPKRLGIMICFRKAELNPVE